MRILMVAPRFYPHIGGVEKHVLRVSQELRLLGNDVTVVTEAHEDSLPMAEVYQGIQVHRVPRRSLWAMWRGTWKLRSIFQEADVVHCHDHHTLVGWIPHLRLRFRGKPFYVTFHGYEAFPPRWHHRVLRRLAVRLSQGHVCIGSYIGRWYRGQCNLVRCGGVDPPEQRPPPGEPDHVVFIGRLAHDTEILGYLEAVKMLRERGLQLKVDICGDGPLRLKVEEVAASLGEDIRVHGHVPAVEPFLLRARFAFASRYLAILEAMAHGRLVFALYGNAIRRDYVLSLPRAEERMIVAGYPEALAEAFEEIVKDPEKENEYVRSAEAFARELTWQSFAQLYLQLYRRHRGEGVRAPADEEGGDVTLAR